MNPCFSGAIVIVVDKIPDPKNENERKYAWAHIIGYILSWMTVFVNPLIYILSNKFFRNAAKKSFSCAICKRQNLEMYDSVFSTWDRRRSHNHVEMQSDMVLDT